MLKPIVALGLDVGATRIKAVIVENDGTILDQIVLSTQQQGWTDQIADLINEVLPMCGPALEIGVCTPGLATRSGDAIWDCGGKIPGLQGLNWQKHFGWERPIPVMNDAQAALFGESWLGAATGRRNVALFTLGTGVGGAAMVDGKLLHGALGRAGHFGHISINPDPRQSVLNAPGSLEDAFGTMTLERRSNGKFQDMQDLIRAAHNGNVFAADILDRATADLARGIVSIINVLDPELILLGGGIAAAGETLLAAVRPKLDLWEWRPDGLKVELEIAGLGDWAGAFGAARRVMELSSDLIATNSNV
jgi:glucokinase